MTRHAPREDDVFDPNKTAPDSTGRSELRDKVYRLSNDLGVLETILDGSEGGYTELKRIVLARLRQAVLEMEGEF